GPQTERAVRSFQGSHRLTADGVVGSHTLHALEQRGRGGQQPGGGGGSHQQPSRGGNSGGATPGHEEQPGGQQPGAGPPEYDQTAKTFTAGTPGTSPFTWHAGLYLPSWHRHANHSEVTSAILGNIQRQAAALDKLRDHFGKAIVVH